MRTQQVWRSRPEYDVLSENGWRPGARGLGTQRARAALYILQRLVSVD